MSEPMNTLVGVGDPLAVTPNTDVGKALTDAGSNFGALLLGIGTAVAATQQKLTETSAETTSKLAATMVDVIAVQETTYNDHGEITGSQAFTQKLPLINFVDPVFYEYPQVRVQGRFSIREIATSTESTTDVSSSGGGIGLSFNGVFGGGGGFNSGSQTTNSSTETNVASSVGQVRMFAQITPRTDVGVPKPTQVIVGPSISIIEGEIKDTEPVNGVETPIVDADGTPMRTMSVIILLKKKTGEGIDGKHISIETDGTPWSYASGNEDEVTGSAGAGNVAIKLKRLFPTPPVDAPPLDKSPKQVALKAYWGLVNNGATLTF
jgi:hypothetical protein